MDRKPTMKKLLILLALSTNAYAHEGEIHDEVIAQPTQPASGSTSTRVANSAISPAVQQFDPCPIISPSSKAASIFIASASGTTGVTMNPICVAWHLGQKEVVKQMACNASGEYRKAIEQVGLVCK